ncbi:histidine decarboxylase [Streptacidiphilus sp. PB12-B1b]|uniref:histidine decarboxylase n=1 Tax=Streptacidiphilus sp. PB12-B1b TaxID=2705012 RepID=UPI0015F8EC27|nr:histidine decarboxylase [Streptacidiphilus sp. PB12-B1b]QMU75116.1 histidine decarboxylase [Streptacidiphilus sp. PB12-B1b]
MIRTETLPAPADHDRPAGLEPDAREFAIPAGGLDQEQRLRALNRMDEYLTRKRRHLLGFQATQEMGGSAFDLGRFMQHNINNLGDPFQSGGYKPNTKAVERAVLDYYAALWHAAGPHHPDDPESYWGYVLSMGSTEGNMYALWNARDYLSGKPLIRPRAGAPDSRAAEPAVPTGLPGLHGPNARRPVAFYSEDTHYSFAKAVCVLGVETFHAVGVEQYPGECPLVGPQGEPRDWPAEVPSRSGPSGHSWDGTGEIDIDALAALVEFFAAKGHPVFVSLNLGSTFKGAHDDVRGVCERLLPIFERHGLIQGPVVHGRDRATGEPSTDLRRRFWIHVDGALGAGYAPFMRMAGADDATDFGWAPETGLPEFDFGLTLPTRDFGELDMVSSIAMSGHKWLGAPWPCGIYMTKVKYQVAPPSQPDYTGAPDTTFAGSRNGFSPLVLWDHLSRHSYQDQVDRIRRSQQLAAYLEQQLRLLELEKDVDLWPARTPGAITVRFRKPGPELVAKWSLSSQDVLTVPGDETSRRSYAHVFLMSSVDRAKLDALLTDLGNDPVILGTARPAAAAAAATAAGATATAADQPTPGSGEARPTARRASPVVRHPW